MCLHVGSLKCRQCFRAFANAATKNASWKRLRHKVTHSPMLPVQIQQVFTSEETTHHITNLYVVSRGSTQHMGTMSFLYFCSVQVFTRSLNCHYSLANIDSQQRKNYSSRRDMQCEWNRWVELHFAKTERTGHLGRPRREKKKARKNLF
jgi:hypothetical protein